MERRTLLKVGGATLLALAPLPLLFDRKARQPLPEGRARLLPDPAGLLDLPQGFRYHIVDRALERMSDGYRVPGRPDGMACFPGPDGSLILMRNHECDRLPSAGAYDGAAPPEAYDPKAFGGVTRVVLDKGGNRISNNLVLTGTMRNCAGGMSPWGWLSCEENLDPGHGYVFICATDAARVARPRRIEAFGRFNHEAACVDPRTMATYLTEDRPDSCLYRFLPHDPARPFEGKLQALAVARSPRADTGSFPVGKPREVTWVDVRSGNSQDDTLRYEAQELGAAILRRGEGMWFGHDGVYACSTIGGAGASGQILRIAPEAPGKPASIEVIAESASHEMLDMPDNITIAPWGDVYMAEDGSGEQFIRALTPRGRVYDVARNARSRGELAGVCFSPDGKTLFFNMQLDGLTIAVSGPFSDLGQA